MTDQEHAVAIRKALSELNVAIVAAEMDGLTVEIDTAYSRMISTRYDGIHIRTARILRQAQL